MANQEEKTSDQWITKKTPHDFVFTRWMGSWERHLSLWSNELYSSALLSYIGKIYRQQANIYYYFDRLWRDSLQYSFDELDLLHFLLERLSKVPGANSSVKIRQETSRIEGRLNELKLILNSQSNTRFQIKSNLSVDQLIDLNSIDSYLDLGCGNGLITANVGNYLKLKREQIFGCDVFNAHNDQLTFVEIDEDQSKISLANQSISLITCLVTLHHLPNLDRIVQELARILKPNGYLIIREHDCKLERSLDAKYLNFIHAIMMIARIGEFSNDFLPNSERNLPWNEEKKKIIRYTKSIKYRTRDEWENKLHPFGFDLLATYDYDRKKSSNPQHLFYALYKRNESSTQR